ncbi:MAG: hypothetical protein GKC02_10320 [Methanomassiliicoccales archaeon]|nr:hypothetical protein [Methanomassiliicoccales archaeon]
MLQPSEFEVLLSLRDDDPSGSSAPRWGAIEVPAKQEKMKLKVLWALEIETFKDETKRKEYYEYNDIWGPLWQKKHEGVKFNNLGGWSDNPGHVTYYVEYENMEELAKVWSDEELQKGLVKLRNHCEKLNIRIMRPTVTVR